MAAECDTATSLNSLTKSEPQAWLKKTNFGRVTILGGPGAGKSTLGIEICDAVLAGPPQAHYVNRDSLPLVQTSIVDDAEDDNDDDNEDGADGMKGAPKWPGTDQMELIRAKINEVDVDMQETMETEDFPAPPDGCIIGSGWDDALGHFRKRTFVRLRTVLFPADLGNRVEMLHECLLQGTCRRDQLRQVDAAWPGLVRSEDVAHFGLPWKESANGLVSDLALESDYGVVDNDKETWAEFHEAVRNKVEDPDTFRANKERYGQAVRVLLDYTDQKCRAIYATPVAMAQFLNHVEWKPDLVIVDEAGRMTEMSDVRRFRPMAPAQQDIVFRDMFGPQRETSYLSRVDTLGKVDIVLHSNHRALGTVATWPNVYFYHERMDIVNRAATPVTGRMLSWLRNFSPKLQVNSIFCHVEHSMECPVGTSFTNPTNATFVRELVATIYRDNPMQNTPDSLTKGPKEIRKGSHISYYDVIIIS
ncbi:hypothetical protein EDB80DRAFT_675140 [Ilyonectria destructans]|nr:hypothetical protein EDB80DRAFT_675140 [Ilyonectria destructans]